MFLRERDKERDLQSFVGQTAQREGPSFGPIVGKRGKIETNITTTTFIFINNNNYMRLYNF